MLFVFRMYLLHTVLSVPCSLLVNCCERADILALLCVMFLCSFVTFPYGALGVVLDCIDSLHLPSSLF